MPGRLHVVLSAIAAAAILSSAAAFAAPPEEMTWKIGNDIRTAIVFAPSVTDANEKPPLVLSFHGHGDTVLNFQFTGIQRAYPKAVVAYFQGLPSDRDGLSAWQVETGQNDDRDLKLVDAAIASLRPKFNVDDSRIYATGFSNGAGFVYLLWSARPQLFAAFAPVAGRMRPSAVPTIPRPVLHVAGRADRTVRFADQEDAIELAKKANHAAAGRPCGEGCTDFDGAAPTITWIHDGGHVYPRGTSERIAEFFRQHALKPAATR